jgi:TM2 domain-containing membrane protein YozV
VAADVFCGTCGAVLANPNALCPRCGAQASGRYQKRVIRRPKNPLTAAALAVIPGCGHFYLGHNMKGIAFLIGIGGLEAFGLPLDLTVIGAAVGVPMELSGGALWLFSIVDAYRTARHENEVAAAAATGRYPA